MAAAAPKEERVALFIDYPRPNEDPNEFIGINGKIYILPKGKTSMVPPEVKEEYDRAQRAKNKQHENARKMAEKAEQEARRPW